MVRAIVVRTGCAICAVAAMLLAVIAWNDLYFAGFPDSHLTAYDKAADVPKRVLAWGEWGFVLLFLLLAVWPITLRSRAIGLIVCVVALAVVAAVQWLGVPWYFLTHLGLDNGIGG
ncbi:hypothetical protein [Mycolicibacterium vinylchloridicum]|uniref:hypothetical protein n=1 Tax=Mycolicibacterium vinylchloridicum TaxID=2736928 RepID=UPI0015CEC851|nr:hypothetical protein [Mycolicibacterium vinylchloridicum]